MADSDSVPSDRYVVVARRYRPRGFDQLVGQDHVARALTNALETGRVGHAYLFTGARGVGKTSTARIFAKALNAPEGPTIAPDDNSDISQAIDAGEDIDVLEIDGASNRGIDEIRQLRSGVGVRPSRARFKIYIIDEVHMLTPPAFNALLKTLEEPPEHVKFIFCTTDPEKIPITVLSRCQRFDFAPVRVEAIAGRLREIVDAEKVQADDEALRLLARRAAGSMRDSQSLLEQVLSFSNGPVTVDTVHAMLGTADDTRMSALADALASRDSRAALEMIDGAVLGGVDAGQLAEQLLGFFRDMMTATVGCDADMLRFTGPGMHELLRQQGHKTGLQTILAIVALLDQTLVRIRQSVHGQILLEAAVVQISALPNLDSVARLAAALAVEPSSEKKNARRSAQPLTAQPPTAQPPTAQPLTARLSAARPPAHPPPGVQAGASAVASVSPGAAVPRVELESRTVVPVDRPWNAETALAVWRAALATMDEATADFARRATLVEPQGARGLRLVFASGQELAKRGCEEPERKSKLEGAIKAVSARDVLVVCESRAAKQPEVKQPKPSAAINRRQRMRDAEQHPVVRQLIDLFDAEIVRVDEPRG